ncbi:hypothetical protein FACS1894159_03000 [Bacteroidia bacterium]|nr:hypothetical protein FACS1894159_03000 [Bacteroidia bacterium]
MKINRFYIALTSLALVALSLAGCKDADSPALTDNKVYIEGGFSVKYATSFVDGQVAIPMQVPVKMTQKDLTRDVNVTLEISDAALEGFNSRYNRSFSPFPNAQLDSPTVTIKKGTTSAMATLLVTPITADQAATGANFAVAVKVKSADGADVLTGSESFIYALKRTPRADVLIFNKGTTTVNRTTLMLPFDMQNINGGNDLVFKAYTLEFLFKITEWTSANNYALINPEGAPKESGAEIYTRIEGGSNGLANAVLNVKFYGDQESISGKPADGFKTDRWYHAAFVYTGTKLFVYIDGEECARCDTSLPQLTFDKTMKGFTWQGGSFNGGYSPVSRNAVQSSELRIWTVARTQEQLKESMYGVMPNSDGLIGYWKLNEGTGITIKDYTGKNPDAFFTSDSNHDVPLASPLIDWVPDQDLTIGK